MGRRDNRAGEDVNSEVKRAESDVARGKAKRRVCGWGDCVGCERCTAIAPERTVINTNVKSRLMEFEYKRIREGTAVIPADKSNEVGVVSRVDGAEIKHETNKAKCAATIRRPPKLSNVNASR